MTIPYGGFIPQIIKYHGKSQIHVRIPHGGKWVRHWLRDSIGPHKRFEFDYEDRWWSLSKSHYITILDALLERYDFVVVDAQAIERSTVKCDTRCVEAKYPFDCICACGGVNHQGDLEGYTQIGETELLMCDETYVWARRVFSNNNEEGSKK